MRRVLTLPQGSVLRELSADARLLFVTRITRLFAYGFLSIVLVLYLTALGFGDAQVGILLSLTLLGDTAISFWLTTRADRLGRRRMLLIGAALMVLAGVVFASTDYLPLLTLAAVVGTISPSGHRGRPVPGDRAGHSAAAGQRQPAHARLRLVQPGRLLGHRRRGGWRRPARRAAAAQWHGLAAQLPGAGDMLCRLRRAVGAAACSPEPGRRSAAPARSRTAPEWLAAGWAASFGADRAAARRAVFLDAFAGGLVMQSLLAYWFHRRFGLAPAALGALFLGANVLAGLSALAAARIAARFGLLNTMVWTHLPSNVLLMLVPLMPSLPLAIALVLVRFSISQMDVPTRQSCTMAVVAPDERAAAAGLTNIARTTGSALGPLLTGQLFGAGLLALPLFLAGGLKIVYDLLLYQQFRAHLPPEERNIE